MSQTLNAILLPNSFHIVGHDERGAIVLRQKWPGRGHAAVPDRYGSPASARIISVANLGHWATMPG